MNYLKNILLGITLIFLVGCQSQPEVLFENINVGDNLEACLAKGAVQYFYDDENTFKLANGNIANSYFTRNTVKFDEHKIVKELYFLFEQKQTDKTAEEVFSYMTHYFCQRYQGMKTEKVNETKYENEIEYELSATKNIWETNKIKVELISYTKTVDARVKNKILQPYADEKPILGSHTSAYWIRKTAIDNIEGKYVSLEIVTK